MRTMIDAPPTPPSVMLSFRAAPEFRKRVAMSIRQGRPGESHYFATASDLMQAAITDYLDRIETKVSR